VRLFGPPGTDIERTSGSAGLPANGESLYYDEIHPVVLISGNFRTGENARIITSIGKHHPGEESGAFLWHDVRIPLEV
jgi:hypothetical protein